MTLDEVLQALIARPGQAQGDRATPALDGKLAPVDGRDPLEVFTFLHEMAKRVVLGDGTWEPLLPVSEAESRALLAEREGRQPAHRALLAAVLALRELPRQALDRLTVTHRDHFYQTVLRFEPHPATPDRAHLVLGLKRNATPVRIGPEARFSGGKDASGVELLYAPVREAVIGHARVDSLRTVFVDRRESGTVRFAPIAYSADGAGAALAPGAGFPALGDASLAAAQVGFAVAAPVLRMREGRRKVNISLDVSGWPASAGDAALGTMLDAWFTGEKTWLGPYVVAASVSGATLTLTVEIAATEPAVVDHDPLVHRTPFPTQAPVVQLLLRPGGVVGYLALAEVAVARAAVTVEVSGVTPPAAETDSGPVDPRRSFLPFGAQPERGARLMVALPEALEKRLASLSLTLAWQDLPESFATRYAGYGDAVDDRSFTASASFEDGAGWRLDAPRVKLFDGRGPGDEQTLSFTRAGGVGAFARPRTASGGVVYALSGAGARWARIAADRRVRVSPVLAPFVRTPPAAAPRSGFVTLFLDRDFLHATYRSKLLEYTLQYAQKGAGPPPTAPQEPYTPTVRAVRASYVAESAPADLATATLEAFAAGDVRFFHVGPFGARREHAYARAQLGLTTTVSLVAATDDEGALLVGLSGVAGGDAVTLRVEAIEGSADPDVDPPEVEWSVLCDDHFRALDAAGIPVDTTSGLLETGLVSFALPSAATTDNAFLPAGLLWLKAAARERAAAAARLRGVQANAVEVVRTQGAPGAPLPPGTITRQRTPAPSVTEVAQPAGSFGGRPAEDGEALAVRAAERLRHKARCVTPWDYERTVLAAFPEVHRAKCISHARAGEWLAPGHVLVVVVADPRRRGLRDPLQPKLDAGALRRVQAHLAARCGIGVDVAVRNPRYDVVRVEVAVQPRPGVATTEARARVRDELVRLFSPWAFEDGVDLRFGGGIHRSVVLARIEALPSVDYISDLRLFVDSGAGPREVSEARPSAPDAILTSAPEHLVREAS